jgi:glucan biosynthesis protein
MYEIVDGEPRAIRYRPDLFDFAGSGLDPRRLPSDLSFAGFRVHIGPAWGDDAAVFLGASYFRARGATRASSGCPRAGSRLTPRTTSRSFRASSRSDSSARR